MTSQIRCSLLRENNDCPIWSKLRGKLIYISNDFCQLRCNPTASEKEKTETLTLHLATRKVIRVKVVIPPELQRFYKTCKGICETCGECQIVKTLCKAGHYEKGYFCKLGKWPEPPDALKPAKEILTQ